jgi:signal transduction histidine kinase
MASATPRDHPLAGLRLRLTAWYGATFLVILLLLGGGLFFTIRRQLSRQLDDSLRDATEELARAARIREMEARSAHGKVVDAVDELHILDRTLYLLDTNGRPVKPVVADEWIREAARRAGRRTGGASDVDHEVKGEIPLRLHAERFVLASGHPMVAIAVTDRIELEDRYARLIAAFGGAALVALVLVAAGGSILVRQSTAPVERTIAYMRRFMADAAHELRSPITVLRSRAEVALQQPRAEAEYVAALRGIEAESGRMGRLVEDLLILARADVGERSIDRRRVYLDDIALDAASAAQVVGQRRNITVSVEEFEEAVVVGDDVLLRQLLMILLDNAVKFSRGGSVVRMRVGTTAGGPTVVVEDSGVGIPAEDLPHVFERFYRADRARGRTAGVDSDRVQAGAGLGLSIARWICDAHHATIAISSAPGDGTTVTVTFPSAPLEVAAEPPTAVTDRMPAPRLSSS